MLGSVLLFFSLPETHTWTSSHLSACGLSYSAQSSSPTSVRRFPIGITFWSPPRGFLSDVVRLHPTCPSINYSRSPTSVRTSWPCIGSYELTAQHRHRHLPLVPSRRPLIYPRTHEIHRTHVRKKARTKNRTTESTHARTRDRTHVTRFRYRAPKSSDPDQRGPSRYPLSNYRSIPHTARGPFQYIPKPCLPEDAGNFSVSASTPTT